MSSGKTLKAYLRNKARQIRGRPCAKCSHPRNDFKLAKNIAQILRRSRVKSRVAAALRRSHTPKQLEALSQTGDGAIAREIPPYNIKRRPLPSFTPIPETPSPSRPPALTPLYVSPPKTPSGNWRTSSIVRERAAREKAFQSLHITVKGENRCLPSVDGRIASPFIEDYESDASDPQSQIRDIFTDKDYALARMAEKMVRKRKELQEYRSSSERHINSLINEIEELEENIFHEILNNVAPQVCLLFH
ncbi:hypothetical protein M422DRAFT_249237 [Sphaerobolus stellatus SS14]|uniref:Uncharacterized protein n=1 Tax=Sphaerobolus stellatus (strain SS14) TaxID=990650 RepID=A0A0C9VI42_SPHS4|nr:hypothetical protein M422DRAFT_249237 [Sphaerobolus stellatus SS14]